MRKFIFGLLLLSFVIFPKQSSAQSSPVLPEMPRISCSTPDDCKRKAVIGGYCQAGELCPVLCQNNLCEPDLQCNSPDDCVKKAEAVGFCQRGRECRVLCEGGQCTADSAPQAIDPSDISGVLNRSTSCGHIGEACCGQLQMQRFRLKSPSIWLTPIVALVNGLLSVTDGLVDYTSRIVTNITQTRCVEGSPGDKSIFSRCECLPTETFNIAKLCSNIDNARERRTCINCSRNGVWTALGCFEGNFSDFLSKNLIGWGVGLAGIFSLMCIIYTSIKLQLSRGNPDKVTAAREMLTSCLTGLLLIILSVLILRVVGVDILRIPGFR